ncbi:polymorphic toxin type 50 domain-containing protein, partial [Staphylococcus aureus]|nr:polymorphic toxin type 50 domain-containing protein [Staphylococcus aureus]
KFFKEREGKYQVEVKEAKLQEKAKNQMKEMIESGKIKIEINPEKQNRYFLGHKLYLKNKIYALQNDERFPSYTILSIEELNDLLKKCSMTGKILVDKFGFNRKEIINFEKTIGKAYACGKYINAAYGKIHYSKTGSHIVPFVSKEK